MRIAVIGTGYVGLVTGVCLSHIGHKVTCIDIDKEKIETLQNGHSPIYERGLEPLLQKGLNNKNLHFTTDYREGLSNKEIIYVAVGTPQNEDGTANLKMIYSACRNIGENIHTNSVIVTKSTVPVGTNASIQKIIKSYISSSVSVNVVSNPEFLRQGTAVNDTFNGDRIIIGSNEKKALELMESVYRPFNIPVVKTDLRSAEMIKYASNAFLATKISFINEIANLCEKYNVNVEDVAKGMGMDHRIGEHFLKAGIGYGGSCFPKDTNSIIAIGNENNSTMRILENVQAVNEKQAERFADKIIERFGNLQDITVALLGLSFKAGTDDMRNAPSIRVVNRLATAGAKLRAFDPQAIPNARKVLPEGVNYADSIEEVLNNADCAVIVTEWPEIMDYKITDYKRYLAKPIIFDGRNCFDLEEVKGTGIEYHSIGRPSVYAES